MNLKYIRMAISSIVLLMFLFLFWTNLACLEGITHSLLYLQIVPSIINAIIGVSSMGFLIVLLATVLFGRVYCSILCPLGILQDIVTFISRELGLSMKYSHIPSMPKVRLLMLLFTILLTASGSLVLVSIFDPFSIFGRAVTNIFASVGIGLNNVAALLLTHFDYHFLTIKMAPVIDRLTLILTGALFLLVLVSAFFSGRSYCNIICPVGTLLGYISRYSLFGFHFDIEKCKSCHLCEDVCKAGCIDSQQKSIDSSRCISCFNCLYTCKWEAIQFGNKLYQKSMVSSGIGKRKFISKTGAVIVGVLGFYLPLGSSFIRASKNHPMPITPPGSLGVQAFSDACTSCHLCVSACKTKVLVPGTFRYGFEGLFQPVLDFHIGHCDYNCNACGMVCPTSAILPLSMEEKQQVQIGTASIDKGMCVVYNKKKHCGACGEACPTFAISALEEKNHFAPVIDKVFCIGCGACEKACPTKPKAIIITACEIHTRAEKRTMSLPFQNQAYSSDEQFPF